MIINKTPSDFSHSNLHNTPFVSVITPFLNTQSFIKEAIESVLAQTYKDWELLLVDDGSSDGSTEIAQQYAALYPGKILYLEHDDHQNRGASASRNLGIYHAKGKYIAFLDGDDVWLEYNLELMVNTLESHSKAGMVYGPTQWWYSWTGRSGDIKRDYICELGISPNTIVEPPELFIPLFLTQKAITPCTCSLLIRREVIETIGGFDENFRYIYTDQVFYAKLFLRTTVFLMNEWGAKYRQHSNSSCAIVEETGQSSIARLRFLNWLEKYLFEQNVNDTKINLALQRVLWTYRHPLQYSIFKNAQYCFKILKRLTKSII